MTKILVTGATGCSGKGVLHYLISQGYADLHGLVRNIPEDSFAKVNYIQGDITNKEAINKIFREQEFDSVWHIAGAVHPHTRKDLFHKINVKGTENLVEASIESGVKSFLFTSSISVYGKIKTSPITEDHRIKPLGNYAHSKVETEKIVQTLAESSGMKGGIIRLPVILGKEDRHFYPIVGKLVNANIFPIMGNPNHNFSIIHPYDIGRSLQVIHNANKSKIEAFNTISCNVNFKEMILKIEMYLKGKNRFKYYLPYPLVYFGAWLFEVITHLITPRKDPLFNREYAQLIGKETVFDISKLTSLGYTPLMNEERIYQDMIFPDPVPVPESRKETIIPTL